MNALITVIIPCYNASKYIESCLMSLSHQTFKNFEVIVVDDCSNDGTYEMLKEIVSNLDLKFKVLHNEVNLGPSASRKYAAQCSNSEYLCFCDADDAYSDDFLQNIYNGLNNNPSLIITGYTLIMPNGRKTVRFASKDVFNVNKGVAFLTGVNSLCALCVKKDLFLSVKHTDIRNGEDMAVIPLLISQADTINVLSNSSYLYYCRQGSASKTSNMKVVESLLSSFHHIESNVSPLYSEFVEFLAIKNVLYGCLLNLFKFSYDVNKAKEIIGEIEERYPRWYDNQYYSSLPKQRKFFVFFVRHKFFPALKLLSELHKIAVR